jgi:chromosome segregation ATPase
MGRQPGAGRRWRVRHIAVGIVVVGAVATGGGLAANAWFDTRDETDRTIAALRDTRAELAEAEDDLATATNELEAERATLRTELEALGTRQDERDTANDGLEAARLQLADLQTQLEAATSDLENRTTRLDALNRCLVGVAKALNQASVNDIDGMAATIDGIEGTCAQAGAQL